MNAAPLNVDASGQSRVSARTIYCWLTIAAVLYGVISAWQRMWMCDDAFISFRYALNLVEGRGLVYNPGERVEGYSNFLWTLWCAVGLTLGIRCEYWSAAWGLACYAASIGLIGAFMQRVRSRIASTWPVPLAAILAALHADWAVFATSGLETSLFTFLAIAGFVLIAGPILNRQERPVWAGGVMMLASLTRPDGVLFAFVGGALVLWYAWPRWKPAAWYAAAFTIPFAAFLAWRIWYYGDVFPNTYYAKSGGSAWWGQGWVYLVVYFQRYIVLLVSLPAVLLCARLISKDATESDRARWRLCAGAGLMAAMYGLYVTRVGGDFMFARMWIPATPFLFLMIELGLLAIPGRWSKARTPVGVLFAACLILPSAPMKGRELISGIANEWDYYRGNMMHEENDKRSAILRKYLGDLPVTLAYFGSEAHMVYRARIHTAIEAEAGLTDAAIARQTLTARGRIGHEKNGTAEYVIGRRKAHFTFHPEGPRILQLDQYIAECPIVLDQVAGWVLHWDPSIMAELERRGAKFAELPAEIDRISAELRDMDDATVRDLYGKLRLMYFDHVPDPQREAAYKRRLGL